MTSDLIDVDVRITVTSTSDGKKFEDVVLATTHYGVERAYLALVKAMALAAAGQLESASIAAIPAK